MKQCLSNNQDCIMVLRIPLRCLLHMSFVLTQRLKDSPISIRQCIKFNSTESCIRAISTSYTRLVPVSYQLDKEGASNHAGVHMKNVAAIIESTSASSIVCIGNLKNADTENRNDDSVLNEDNDKIISDVFGSGDVVNSEGILLLLVGCSILEGTLFVKVVMLVVTDFGRCCCGVLLMVIGIRIHGG